MTEDVMMRVRLQQVAAYRDLCRRVRQGGRGNVFFALLMLFLAYISSQAGRPDWVLFVFVGLALAELAAGLFKMAFPSAEGVLIDALILLAFAGFNLGMEGLRLAAGAQPTVIALVFGVYMLVLSFSRFKDYGTLRRLFADRPTPELMAWVDELAAEIRSADPHTDEFALDLPTEPPLWAKLLGSTAFFVTAGGEMWVAGPDEFRIEREKRDRGEGWRRARLRIADRQFAEFEIEDASWENYRKWMESHSPARS